MRGKRVLQFKVSHSWETASANNRGLKIYLRKQALANTQRLFLFDIIHLNVTGPTERNISYNLLVKFFFFYRSQKSFKS